MNEPQQANFEGWGIVELMGHQREIGYVTTQAFGQAVMFRIDTPELQEREYELTRPEWVGDTYVGAGSKVKRPAVPARSRLVSPGSLYAINPCTEEAARQAIEKTISRPLLLVKAIPVTAAALSAADNDDDIDDDGSDRCENCNRPLELCECPI